MTKKTIASIFILLSFVLVIFAFEFGLPWWSQRKCEELAEALAPKRYLSCGAGHWSLLRPLQFRLDSLKVGNQSDAHAQWVLAVEKLRIRLDVARTIQSRQPSFFLNVKNLKAEYVDLLAGKGKEGGQKTLNLPSVVLAGLSIKGGSFTYRDRAPRRSRKPGELQFTHIELKTGPIDPKSLRKKPLKIDVTGRLDQGHLSLQINKAAKAPLDNLVINAHVKGADLQAVNSYTLPVEGIGLTGSVIEASARSKIKGHTVQSSVQIRYKGLEVDFSKSKERGAIEAFFTELLASHTLCEQSKTPQRRFQSRNKKNEDSWVQFYLMGLLNSSLKAACYEV